VFHSDLAKQLKKYKTNKLSTVENGKVTLGMNRSRLMYWDTM
jgi:hypothetical protein